MPSGPRDTKDIAAAAIASGSTLAVAADLAGVSEGTISRWKRDDPDFVARISDLRAAAIASALGILAEGMSAAATALNVLVRHRNPDTKLRAAVQVLTLGLRLREQTDLAERLAAIEKQLRSDADGSASGSAGAGGSDTREPHDDAGSGGGEAVPG